MKKLTLILAFSMLAVSLVYAGSEKSPEQAGKSQIIYRPESQKSFKGPEDFFTGDVQVEMLFPSNVTAHYSGAYVALPGSSMARMSSGRKRSPMGNTIFNDKVDKKRRAEIAEEVLNTVLNSRE